MVLAAGRNRSTVLATTVARASELSLFASWRCHARRLGLPFLALAAAPGLRPGLLEGALEGEEVAVARGAAGWLRRLRALLAMLPEGTSALHVSVDAVLLRRPRLGPLERGRADVCLGGGAALLWLRSTGRAATLLEEAISLGDRHGVWRLPEPRGAALLLEASRLPRAAGAFCRGWPKESSALPLLAAAYGGRSGGRAAARAMRQEGRWLLAERGAFEEVVGTWDVEYPLGLRMVYKIAPDGRLSAERGGIAAGTGWLRSTEAGGFDYMVSSLHFPSSLERLRIVPPGSLALQLWEDTSLLGAGTAHRRVSSPALTLPVCGCPEGTTWCTSVGACLSPAAGCRPVIRVAQRLDSVGQTVGVGGAPVLPPRPLPQGAARLLAAQRACSHGRVREVRLGPMDGGGFGSKLQLAAARAAKAARLGLSWRLSGHLGWYTNNSGCLRLLGLEEFTTAGWRCHFAPLAPVAGRDPSCRRRPLPFPRAGVSWSSWQAALLRPSPALRRSLARLAERVGYDFTRPLLAVHVRRGDKPTNLYNRYHPAKAYVAEALRVAEELLLCRAALCQLFVASDAPEVLEEAREAARDFGQVEVIGLTGSASQRRSGLGVELAREELGEEAYRMALEVLFDLELLSRAKVLVATLASQVARVAASVGRAHGSLLRAVALDAENLGELGALFEGFGVRLDDVPWETAQIHGRP